MSAAPPMNKKLHVALFFATCATTFFACFVYFGGGVLGTTEDKLWGSAFFAFGMVSILLAHELGHYLMARQHDVDATWPYFIPFPLGFGTLGAVIRLRGRIPNRDALVDIGAAGPLCGLLIAIPLLAAGVWLSHVKAMPDDMTSGVPPAYSLLGLSGYAGDWLSFVVRGTAEPSLPKYETFGDNLLTWAMVRLIHGELKPGHDLIAHPLFLAAWFGLLMTMLNLLPVGQLDGGHLTFAWYGAKAEQIGVRIAQGALICSLFFSVSWLVWFFLATRVVGTGHPPVEAPEQPLSRGRKVIVVICWVMTGLTFMPMPLSLV